MQSSDANHLQLLSILDANPDPVYVVDPETYEILYVNKAFIDVWGLSKGKKCYERLQNRDEPCPFCTNLLILGENFGQVYNWEFQNQVNRRWYRCTDRGITWPDGRRVRYEMATDITSLKLAQDESEKLASVIRYSRELVNLADPDGSMVFLNDAGKKMLGIREEQIPGTTIMDVIPQHLKGLVRDQVLPAIERDGYWEGDLQYVNLETSALVDVHATTFRIDDPKTGRLRYYANVSQDITERKRSEIEKQDLQEQLAQAQKLEAVGRLAGGVAHDFNNMLSVIIGNTELALERGNLTPVLRAGLEEVRGAAVRSTELTGQLLAFARKQTIAPKVIDLNESVERMLKMLRRLIGEGVDLEWMPDADLWKVKIDTVQMDQVLVNLSINARDAIEGTGRVTIETKNVSVDESYCSKHAYFIPGDYVMLAVSDNGHGMDRETMANIFEPFFTTKDPGKGTGLGLAMVYGIVKQNNGFINTYSEPGKGTSMKIYLPRYAGGVESQHGPGEEKEPGAGGNVGTGTILLVEDEPAILKMIKVMLEKQGYTVLAAATAD
ncbi:MAG: ATP-binding protein, partial [Candidatus Krumholzibacteria bacterium]|nr:ATP-binding protein [Candidatus Krumholzibacteria bacterium]